MKKVILLVVLVSLLGCKTKTEIESFTHLNNQISLDGEWHVKSFDYGMGTWKPAWGIFMAFPPPNTDSLKNNALMLQVPGSVQHNLTQQKLVKDPYVGDNVKDILWVEEKEWWYVKQVKVPENWKDKFISLQCNMINYQADVWVNQHWCGRTIGNYQAMDIKVAKHLRLGEINDIVIRLRAPENSTKAIQDNWFLDWTKGLNALHKRPWVTPSNPQAGEYLISKCLFGWDWGPHIVPIGILQPIKLVAENSTQLKSVFVKTQYITSNSALLNIDFELTNTESEEITTTVEFAIVSKQSNKAVKTGKFRLNIPANSIITTTKQIDIQNPELWWPNNYGEQNLYTIQTQVLSNQEVVDNYVCQFGIRTVEKVRNEDENWLKGKKFMHEADAELENGEYDWTFVINGEKIFVQGMNSIPMDAMLDLSPELYQYNLRCAAEANINMLRVWGEGLYETDLFYNICDSLGLLIWQDFWVGSYSPAQPQEDSWEAVKTNIVRTRNHPSLVLYCGGNEFDATRSDRLEQLKELDRLIKEHDGTREFHKASPHGGNVHGGMGIIRKEERKDKYARFCSEAGYQQSWPPRSDMLKFLNEDQLFPLEKNQYWLSVHNSMLAGYPDWQHAVYGVPQNLDEVIHTEMLHNTIGWQAQLENTRLERFKVSGCLFWALNDVWPTTSWSMISWYGTCKNHYYAFKKAASPIQVTASQQNQIVIPGENYDLEVCVINDNLKPFENIYAEASIYLGQQAKKVYRKSFTGSVNANSVVCLGNLDWIIPSVTKEHNFLLVLNLYDANHKQIAKNEYVCMIGEKSDDGSRASVSGGYWGEYRKWTKNHITPKLIGFPESLAQGEEKEFSVVYKNNTNNVVMGLETLITDLPKGVRFYIDDNYVHLLPEDEVTLKASIQNTERSETEGELQLTLQTDGWNIKRTTEIQKLSLTK